MKTARPLDLDRSLQPLFERWPALCGFSVKELRTLPHAREIVFRDVAIAPWAGHRPSADLLDALATTLLDLIDERPEAGELLAGRTFAPAIH